MRTILFTICLFGQSGVTTVGKGISILLTTFIFTLQGTKLVFEDEVVLCFEVERVMGFLSEKFENKELTRTVVFFQLLFGIEKSSGVEGIFIFEER